jgi:outer membrane murein-binding lipoprotein Lpp
MLKRLAALACVLPLLAVSTYAQGLNTSATKDDWEEINYEYNSSVLVDGFPSLLRLAELLQKNPGYKVKLEGHTDRIGGDQYNEKLGLARANTVRDFLVKYGARPGQIDVTTRGKVDPKYPGQKPTYSKTDEARWMNRRVVITVTDDQGRTVSAAGVGDAIRAIEQPKPQGGGMTDCCSEVLKRLDKLDDIAKALKDLADQNAALRRDLDALKQQQQVADSRANQPTVKPPTADEVAAAVVKDLPKPEPKFQVLGINLGADGNQHLTATGRGRFFGPFGEHYALQAQGEFLYYKDQKEGQADLGIVDRIGRFQGGLFGSFKHVALSGNQNGGTLGQASLTLDYLFKQGKVGLFGTYAFMNSAQINSVAAVLPNGVVSPDLLDQRFLRAINQAGVSFTLGLWKENYLEGNFGYLKSEAYGDRAGGTLRFIFPVNAHFAVTVEGGLNETLLGRGNNGRAVAGVQFGNALRPKEYLGTSAPVPVDVPRVRYEIINKQVRIGHTPPVADAGPDQIGVPAGPITLNASTSYSPDGLPITFQWIEDGGPAVTLSNPTSAITSFPAAAGQSYIFRVVVKDSLGGTGQARVRVTTNAAAQVAINFFNANPSTITAGQSATLSWSTANATSVTLSGQGPVALTGSQPVAPTVTTTYTLTATNGTSTQTATAVVVVNPLQARVLFCTATPMNINKGESATISYQTLNATSVSINQGIGNVPLNGSVPVSPQVTTTYTITAVGAGGTADQCGVAVTVSPGQVPRIINFSAVPATINAGQNSTLVWDVENAASVTITPNLGSVSLNGSQIVAPAATTEYTITATNPAGTVTAKTTVNVIVIPPPVITSFTANPNPSPSPTSAVLLSCQTQNAVSVTMAGILFLPGTSSFYVHPTQNTTYTCIATGQDGKTVTQSIPVVVNQPVVPPPTTPPVIVIVGGPTIDVQSPPFTEPAPPLTVNPDASNTYSPVGNNPLSFAWTGTGVTITGGTTSKPSIALPGPGIYVVNLAVTDSKGNVANQVVVIDWQFNKH